MLLKKLKELNILVKGKTVTDLGSGTGIFITHVALFEDVQCIGIEQIENRFVSSVVELRNLSDLFDSTNVYFAHLDILRLTNLNTDIVYAFNSVFTNTVNDHIIGLLTKEDCIVKHVVLYTKIDLEDESKGKKTEWRAMKAENGDVIKIKMSLMLGSQSFTCKIYERVTAFDRNIGTTIDPLLKDAWTIAGDPSARHAACEILYDSYYGCDSSNTETGDREVDDQTQENEESRRSEKGYNGSEKGFRGASAQLICSQCGTVWVGELGSLDSDSVVCRKCSGRRSTTSATCTPISSSICNSSKAIQLRSRDTTAAVVEEVTAFFNADEKYLIDCTHVSGDDHRCGLSLNVILLRL